MSMELDSSSYMSQGTATDPGAVDYGAMPVPRLDWTKGLTWICGLCILVGGYSLYRSAVTFGSLLSDESEAVEELRSADTRSAAAMAKWAEEVEDVRRQYGPVTAFLALFQAGLGVAFLFACPILLSKRKNAHWFLFNTCSLAIFCSFCGVVLFVLVVIGSRNATEEMSAALKADVVSRARSHGGHLTKEEIKALDSATSSFRRGFATGAAFGTAARLAVAAIFFGLIMIYLTRPTIRQIFGEDPYEKLAAEHADVDAGFAPA
jgi:hypothetical protein